MATYGVCAIFATLLLAVEPVVLREAGRVGDVTGNVVTLKAEGLYRPQAAPEAKEREVKPLALKVETRLDFAERVAAVAPDGGVTRVIRKIHQATSAIQGEVRAIAAQVRPEVAVLVVERRAGKTVAFSPGGPLTRPELELVEGAGDPLALAALLTGKPVAVGDRWTVGAEAARSLSGYDALALNRLEATLEALDDVQARFQLAGEVRGAALGGEGQIRFDGQFTLDRKAGRIDHLSVTRTEMRKPGPVEAGLEMKSTLTIDRRGASAPPELSDDALAGLPTDAQPHRELLLFAPPEGQYTLLHDRDWHTFWDDARMTVLKRLDGGEVVAQCNLTVGPFAGKGRHQDPAQFRDDIRRALGSRFGQIVGAGEVDGPPGGGYRYKVDVQGRSGDVDLRWYYYLVASPAGDQLLVTFTLLQDQAERFADQDLQMVGSLQWNEALDKPK